MREVTVENFTTEKLLKLKGKRKKIESLGQSILLWEKILGVFNIEVYLIYNVVLVSGIQQSDSDIYI